MGVLAGFFAAGLGVVSAGAPGPALSAVLWGMAALGAGFVVGFLFAVPRVSELGSAARLKINNNLVEVSDWLTKIIVGLGLIHLSRLPGYLERAGYYVGRGLRAGVASPVPEQFAAGLLLYFAVLGFLAGYLVTRLALGPAFRLADKLTTGEIESLIAAEVESEPGQRLLLAPSLRGAAAQLAAMPLAEVAEDADQLTAWARAKFEEEHYAEALQGFARAIRLNPNSPRIHYLNALALKYSRAPQADVVGELEAALRLIERGEEPAMRLRVYISYTFNALFLPPPDGFRRARKAAEDFLKDADGGRQPEILVNLACALGQEHAFRTDPAVKADLRVQCLAAIRRTLEIDPAWKRRFIELLNGEGDDNDLASFRGDAEFRTLLGL